MRKAKKLARRPAVMKKEDDNIMNDEAQAGYQDGDASEEADDDFADPVEGSPAEIAEAAPREMTLAEKEAIVIDAIAGLRRAIEEFIPQGSEFRGPAMDSCGMAETWCLTALRKGTAG